MGWREYHRDPYTYERDATLATRRLIWTTVIAFFVTALLYRFSTQGRAAELLFVRPLDIIERFYLWQLVTYGFCHTFDSIFHLLINMFMLYWFGRKVNTQYGNRQFVFFYLTAIVFAGLVYVIWQVALAGSVSQGMLGASGAVMGVAVIYALLWPHDEFLLFFVIRIKAWVLVLILVGMDLFSGVILPSGAGVAYLAHLGGAGWGWLWVRYSGAIIAEYRARERLHGTREDRQRARAEHQEAEHRASIDELLAKISRDGIGALSEREKNFLKDSSKKYQARQDSNPSWRAQ